MNAEVYSFSTLTHLFRRTPTQELSPKDNYVIFSDLHLGDGSSRDDFLPNSDLFLTCLKDYYHDRGYKLILNGDIEELQRYPMATIRKQWGRAYDLLDSFESGLFRIFGNHDHELSTNASLGIAPLEALRFRWNGNDVFIFHGHQTSQYYTKHNDLVGLALRVFANPLAIKNYSVAHDSRKRFRTEQRVYEFSSRRKVLSIIGHTHRPLFESMSKVDSIKFQVEELCRIYPEADAKTRSHIEEEIRGFKKELQHVRRHHADAGERASLYNSNLVVPCMFNSGCVIGKRGITGLEIRQGRIALVHWFDENRSVRYLQYENHDAVPLGNSGYYRVVIKEDSLDYIFSRIKLLA